uniref:Uncharacterized protein n=1 Tax=Rangifer tarandus platyrhynchus TaxID=3082113 RepID=A0ACB0F8E8_RANTA|nr:unnamed protein product [Rangifer tarandus platyrhynchus]
MGPSQAMGTRRGRPAQPAFQQPLDRRGVRSTKPGGERLGAVGVLLARALSEKARETYLKVKPSPFVREHFGVIPAFHPFLGCHGGSPFLAMSAL